MKTLVDAFVEARALRAQTHPDNIAGGTFTWEGNPGQIYSTESLTAHKKPYEMKPIKAFWLREEISIADELLALAPALTEEFLAYHDTFADVNAPTKLTPYINPVLDVGRSLNKLDAWMTDSLKYKYPSANLDVKFFDDPEVSKRFPTATALTKKYLNDCLISSYSVITPNSIIYRHTGPENEDGKFLRIHVPLIIPEGDIFFECEGVEIDWTDIWAFDNQLLHSAHNYTNHRRLIYLIDIRRSALGIPDGSVIDLKRQIHLPPFERGKLPKILHKHQRDNL